MKLHEAVANSTVHAAYRPWELDRSNVEEYDQKCIVVNGSNEDVYVVWANSFVFARELFPQEYYKIKDKLDWEPVSPKGENV